MPTYGDSMEILILFEMGICYGNSPRDTVWFMGSNEIGNNPIGSWM